MLYRKIESEIINNLKTTNKITIVEGANHIGKSFIIRHIGKKLYKNYIEINLLTDKNNKKLFEKATSVEYFHLILSSIYGDILGSKEDTLVFLDEIQEYPHLLTLLKFLREEGKYTYIASGSKVELALNETSSIPMGSIDILKMYPLDFEEFLLANNVNQEVIDYMETKYKNNESIEDSLHEIIMDLFKKYLFTGGLPEVVDSFIKEKNVMKCRSLQNEILRFYKNDASKYDKERKLKIVRIYELIPSTLENTKKRLIIKDIDEKNNRISDYLEEFDYLSSSGISIQINSISNPVFPLIATSTKNLVKLYLNDVGLLTNIYYKNSTSILFENSIVNLGNVYEQFVAQELYTKREEVYYYDNKKLGEVDFLINDYDNINILPIEVKSGNDYKKHNSLNKFLNTYNIKKGIVLSNNKEVEIEDNITYYPIYYIMFIKKN